MTTIHKYPLPLNDTAHIEVPLGAKLLHAGLDPHDNACVWCEVNPANPLHRITLHVVGTGHPVLPNTKHWQSFNDGPFMWHIYLPL